MYKIEPTARDFISKRWAFPECSQNLEDFVGFWALQCKWDMGKPDSGTDWDNGGGGGWGSRLLIKLTLNSYVLTDYQGMQAWIKIILR